MSVVAVAEAAAIAVGSGASPPMLARADCAPKLKLVPIRATATMTATPAATTRLGRGRGIWPRRNGSSTNNQLTVATGTARAASATAWAGEMVSRGPTSQIPPRIRIGQCHR